jgi:SAM-dependent methyltransferase
LRRELNKLKSLVPKSWRLRLREARASAEQKLLFVDRVTDWSVLRRVRPYRAELGGRRGKYIDRYYIEKFLATYQESIQGRAGEFEGDDYTKKFGGNRVTQSEILDLNEANNRRTMTLDLAQTNSVPAEYFDCIICTQTLLFIENYSEALRSLHKMLSPGGTLLVTVPGISPVIRGNLVAGLGQDFWRFTARSIAHIFAPVFDEDDIAVHSYGNVLTATAFLHGLVQEELTTEEMDFNDPDYEVIIAVRATKPLAP